MCQNHEARCRHHCHQSEGESRHCNHADGGQDVDVAGSTGDGYRGSAGRAERENLVVAPFGEERDRFRCVLATRREQCELVVQVAGILHYAHDCQVLAGKGEVISWGNPIHRGDTVGDGRLVISCRVVPLQKGQHRRGVKPVRDPEIGIRPVRTRRETAPSIS